MRFGNSSCGGLKKQVVRFLNERASTGGVENYGENAFRELLTDDPGVGHEGGKC
jgi:hypothetical protein